MRERRVDDGQLIFKLHGAEVVIGGLRKGAPATGHAAIVGVQHGKAMLREQLVEEQAVAPAIGDGLRAGPSIGIHDQRHARRRVALSGSSSVA